MNNARIKDDCLVVDLNGKDEMVTVISKDDWDKIKDHKWYSKRIPNYRNRSHAMTNIKKEDGKWTTLSMHRLLMDATVGLSVDHINGDPLDNRRVNLRLATPEQNSANINAVTNSKSGYRGVFKRGEGRYQARLGANYLGMFKTVEAAARAYDRAKIKKHGEFASTNGMENWKA